MDILTALKEVGFAGTVLVIFFYFMQKMFDYFILAIKEKDTNAKELSIAFAETINEHLDNHTKSEVQLNFAIQKNTDALDALKIVCAKNANN